MDVEAEMLARSYAELTKSPAFLDLMDWMDRETSRLETAALVTEAALPVLDKQAAIIAWQKQRIIVKEIRFRINECIESLKEENDDERAVRDDRASRGDW